MLELTQLLAFSIEASSIDHEQHRLQRRGFWAYRPWVPQV